MNNKPITKLKHLFEGDNFLIIIGCNQEKAHKASELLMKAKKLGFEFNIEDYFDFSVMDNSGDGQGFNCNSWEYIGIFEGKTYIGDTPPARYSIILPLEHFENLVENTENSVNKNQVVLENIPNCVISGGVVVVTYKNGQTFHLKNNGKATVDVDNKIVITEHTFFKDGQKAYERVEIDINDLDSVKSDSLELKILGKSKVSFTTNYVI